MKLGKFWRYTFYRNFSNSVARRNAEKKLAETSDSSNSSSPGYFSARMPTNFEKKMLVFSGRYKTIEEIPKLVLMDTLANARTKIRIRIANLMILVTLISCGLIIYNGKVLKKERIKKWEEREAAAKAEQKEAAQE